MVEDHGAPEAEQLSWTGGRKETESVAGQCRTR